MNNFEIKFRATLELDGRWASNHSEDELIEYIKHRLNSSLGFRGAVKKFRVVRDRKKRI